MRSLGVEQKVFGDRRFEVELVLSGRLPPLELITTAMCFPFSGDDVLLVRLADRDWHPPGGHREVDEAPRDAAVREVREEAGVEVTGLVPFAHHRFTALDPMPHDHPYPVPTAYQVYFVGRVAHGVTPAAGTEAVEARFFTADETRSMHAYVELGELYEEAMRCALAPAKIRPNGEPMAADPPYGCQVAVVREGGHGWETLLIHRSGAPPHGPWAWGAPTGGRHPGEDPSACAARELWEETGLDLPLVPLPSADWGWYLAFADADAEVRLSDEHDAHEWVLLDDAVRRCLPEEITGIFEVIRPHLHAR